MKRRDRHVLPALCAGLCLATHAAATPLIGVDVRVQGLNTTQGAYTCTGPQITTTDAPTAGPYTASLTGVQAAATLSPTPAVEASIQGAVSCPSMAYAFIAYALQLTAAPHSVVPLDMYGRFSLAVPSFSVGAPVQGVTTTVAGNLGLALGDAFGNNSSTVLNVSFAAERFDTPTGASSLGSGRAFAGFEGDSSGIDLAAHIDGIGSIVRSPTASSSYDTGWQIGLQTAVLAGDVQGQVEVHTDDLGVGFLSVSMWTQVSADRLASVGDMRAFIDPYFSIAADYLVLNPGARLEAVSPFGNAPLGVGEPPTAALLLAAMLAWLRARPARASSAAP